MRASVISACLMFAASHVALAQPVYQGGGSGYAPTYGSQDLGQLPPLSPPPTTPAPSWDGRTTTGVNAPAAVAPIREHREPAPYDRPIMRASHVTADPPAIQPIEPTPAPVQTATTVQPETEPLKLPKPGNEDGALSGAGSGAGVRSLATVGVSLAAVLGLFFVMVWFTRRNLPKSLFGLSKDVVEVLGRAPLAGKQHMYLIRLGRKLILVSVTPSGAETLTEVTDPDDVQHLAALCERRNPNGSSGGFREALSQLGSEKPPSRGWFGRAKSGTAEAV
jgi:flagellar biogenesis protein FliO